MNVDDQDDDDLVQLRTCPSQVDADMVCAFLREHGIEPVVRNPLGGARAFASLGPMFVLRVMVKRGDLSLAKRALVAMQHTEYEDGFDDGNHDEVSSATPTPVPRSPMVAVVLACLVPIGSGHFYARHSTTGKLLCAVIVPCAIAGLVTHRSPWFTAMVLVVVLDALLSTRAVRRFNENRVQSRGEQARTALFVAGVSLALAWVLEAIDA